MSKRIHKTGWAWLSIFVGSAIFWLSLLFIAIQLWRW